MSWRRLLLIVMLVAANPLVASDLRNRWQQTIRNNELDFIRQHWAEVGHVDLPSAQGKTALMAAAAGGDSQLAAVLLRAGADVNAKNQKGGTPLIYAAAKGNIETVRLLLEQGATINQQSVNGWSAVMIAAAKGYAPLIDILAGAGANMNLPDIYGWTPLMRAAHDGRETVVKALLNQPNTQWDQINDQGQTALHLAVIQRQAAIVQQLLAHGAQPDRADFAGNTPRSIGLAIGDQQVLALLNQARGDS